ncbi:hypothetical protein A3K02_02040 [candidate division WS6 bacterium RIFOXYD1_FULL_33_8]|nr:MAG: hypothetical protein A3K02_02040 [candidate division WS6 bacterium RIFOXYD1_FULL_33_8]
MKSNSFFTANLISSVSFSLNTGNLRCELGTLTVFLGFSTPPCTTVQITSSPLISSTVNTIFPSSSSIVALLDTSSCKVSYVILI